MADQTVDVRSRCPKCGNIDEFEVPESGMALRRRGAPLAKAFPDLEGFRLTQLATGVCRTCQEAN